MTSTGESGLGQTHVTEHTCTRARTHRLQTGCATLGKGEEVNWSNDGVSHRGQSRSCDLASRNNVFTLPLSFPEKSFSDSKAPAATGRPRVETQMDLTSEAAAETSLGVLTISS